MSKLTRIKHIHHKPMPAMDEAGIAILASDPAKLEKIGLGFSDAFLSAQAPVVASAMDAGTVAPVNTPQNGTPLQFLQSALPGSINVMTVVRKADAVAPIVIAGDWHGQEVYLKTMEHFGTPSQYSDHGGLVLADFSEGSETRDIARFELGLQGGKLEDARAGATGTNPNGEKRSALASAFENLRNDVAFNGFNIGNSKIYGILNDPNLPAYIAVANNDAGNSTAWSAKDNAEKIADISTALNALSVQAGGNIDITSDALCLEVPLSVLGEFSKSDSSFTNGLTVRAWLTENYSNVEIVSVPQYDGADAESNVFVLKAKKVPSEAGAALGGLPMAQIVPSRMMALGSAQNAKGGVTEGYTSALAGVFVAHPWAIVRYTGI